MDTRRLLDQLLKSGQSFLDSKSGHDTSRSPQRGASQGGLGDIAGQLGGLLGGSGSKVLGAGALGALLGSKRGRKVGGKVLTYGGLAALGVIAYKAYGNWQARQSGVTTEPQTLDRLPAPQVEQHSEAVLKALIAAAKADGHVDGRERQLIEAELGKLTDSRDEQRWLEAELSRPLDPAAVARAARTPEMAAEMYLASLLMVDEEQFMERAYLDELAKQLKLDPSLKAELETQARAAALA